jgi:hypothetical protein
MAISNLRNEPRREITESVIGILTVAIMLPLYVYACHRFVMMFDPSPSDYYPAHIFTILFGWAIGGTAIAVIYWLLVYFTHDVGEFVCGWMKNLGFDPRPKIRYDGNGQAYREVNGYREYIRGGQ